jgi:hypothetical protein
VGLINVFGNGIHKADQSTIIYLSLPLWGAIVLSVFGFREKAAQ